LLPGIELEIITNGIQNSDGVYSFHSKEQQASQNITSFSDKVRLDYIMIFFTPIFLVY